MASFGDGFPRGTTQLYYRSRSAQEPRCGISAAPNHAVSLRSAISRTVRGGEPLDGTLAKPALPRSLKGLEAGSRPVQRRSLSRTYVGDLTERSQPNSDRVKRGVDDGQMRRGETTPRPTPRRPRRRQLARRRIARLA